jgi:cysteine synthase A
MRVRAVTSCLELIGHTPVVRLSRIPAPGAAEVWGKLESFNPAGSVKDRIALGMIEDAERRGALHPGDTIIEATSGNTGVGLACVAALKGYNLVLTMPEPVSQEWRGLLAAYGATVVLTPEDAGMQGAVDRAEALHREGRGQFMPQQFKNPANPASHRRTTGPEILAQFAALDAFVAGVGTGGTITGVSAALRAAWPETRIYAVEPAASAVLSGGPPGPHQICGIGAGFVPDTLDPDAYDEIIQVRESDAAECARRLAREEGILVGITAGANTWAAMQVAERLGAGKTVLTILCDRGERYLTTQVFGSEEA